MGQLPDKYPASICHFCASDLLILDEVQAAALFAVAPCYSARK
jgi:hypothetical protein